MSSIPARMKKIQLKMKALECSQDFSHYKSMGIFPDAQGQLTPQSLVRSGRILNSSEMLWMFLLPSSMEKIRSKTRTVRGSDYSPAIELSEQKDKLVTATGDIEKYSEKQANKVWLNSVYWFSRY